MKWLIDAARAARLIGVLLIALAGAIVEHTAEPVGLVADGLQDVRRALSSKSWAAELQCRHRPQCSA